MTCNLSIYLGTAAIWCLSLLMCLVSAYISWHAAKFYYDWKTSRALARGQDALLNYHYTPLGERIRKPRASLAAAQAGVAQLKRPVPGMQVGWQRRDSNPYSVAAE